MMGIVRTLDTDRWTCFVDRHPHGSVFHTPEMFEVYAQAKGHHPDLWAVTGNDGDVLALLLPVRITLNPLLRALTTRAVAYGSILHEPGPQGTAAARLLLEVYVDQTDRAALFSELRNLCDLGALRSVFCDCGFVYEEHLNYLVGLTGSPEETFRRIGSRTRKNIRRGLRRGWVDIEEVADRAGVAVCYDLIRRSYRRAHVPLADCSLFEAAFEHLHPMGRVRFYLARVDGVPAAASVELCYKDVIYGWYSGLDRDFGGYMPNDLLMWHILKWGAGNGYRVYDFGGAGRPSEAYGVRDFKAKFGGKLVEYGRFTVVHAPVRFKLSRLGYLIYRRLPWFWSGRSRMHTSKEF
jgi:serine/alanine adding enzyme